METTTPAKKRKRGPFYTPTIKEWKAELKDRTPIPSYIDQILPSDPGEGVLLAGRTGIGKTNASLEMAYCLATGTPYYGFSCEQTPVAFFAFEGGDTNYEARIDKIEQSFSDVKHRLRFKLIPTAAPEKMYQEIMNRLEELPATKVAILDGARHIMQGNPSKGDVAQKFIQQFKIDMTELGMVAVLTLQIVKPNPKSKIHKGDIYSIKGAVELLAWATTSLLIERKMRKVDEFFLSFDKHRIATEGYLKSKELTFSHPECRFHLLAEKLLKIIEPTLEQSKTNEMNISKE